MKYQKLLFLILISFTFEIKVTRKLQSGTDLPHTEPETNEPETTSPYTPPHHDPDTTVPPIEDTTTTQPIQNQTETETPKADETDQFGDKVGEKVINNPPASDLKKTPKLFWAGIGGTKVPRRTPGQPYIPTVVFQVYFLLVGERMVMPRRMTMMVKVRVSKVRGLRALDDNTEEKEVEAVGNRVSSDNNTNVIYDCNFNVSEDEDVGHIDMDPESPPKFEGLEVKPDITISSAVNETLADGIEKATAPLKKQYLLNDTTLEKNGGKKFTLKGKISDYDGFNEQTVVLEFADENGAPKKADCDVSHNGEDFTLVCEAREIFNSHLNAVTDEDKKLTIYMKEGENDKLDLGGNSMGLYSRGSSSGLSGGIIAAIVIACVVALLAIAIGAMLCRKTNVPAPFQESTLGVNTSNMTD